MFSPGSICSGDVYRCESGRSQPLPFFLILFLLFYLSRFSSYINIIFIGIFHHFRCDVVNLTLMFQDEEVAMLSELSHLQEVVDQVQKLTTDPFTLPPASEQVSYFS